MQGPGFLFALWPWLRSSERRKERVRAAAGYMNAHPVFSTFALGAMLKRIELGDVDRDEQEFVQWKESLSGPLGMVGDALIWDGWKPIVFALGILLIRLFSPDLLWIGVCFICLLLYNVPLFWLRVWAVKRGYELGRDVLALSSLPALPVIRRIFSGVGALLAIGLFATLLIQIAPRVAHGSWLSVVQFLLAFVIVLVGEWRQIPITYSALFALVAALGLPLLLGMEHIST
jgi:mannose/fructose/N-acetylgalactosamine-specific phosphotransferase system component IID